MAMELAILYVRVGMSQRSAAGRHSVPKLALGGRVHGRQEHHIAHEEE